MPGAGVLGDREPLTLPASLPQAILFLQQLLDFQETAGAMLASQGTSSTPTLLLTPRQGVRYPRHPLLPLASDVHLPREGLWPAGWTPWHPVCTCPLSPPHPSLLSI